MTARFGRARNAAAVACAVMIAVGACDAAVTGAPKAGANPHQFAAGQAFEAALADLESRPVMRYNTTTSGAGSAKLEVRVSRTGAAYATGSVNGDKLTVAAFDRRLFLKTSRQRWGALGAKDGEAKELAGRLSIVDPAVLGFDPGHTLTPKAVAVELNRAYDEHQNPAATTSTSPAPSSGPSSSSSAPARLERKIERVQAADGTEVYRIPLGPNYVEVTVAQPHRIVSTDLPLDGGDALSLLPEGTRTSFSAGDENTLRKLYGLLEKSLTKIKSTAVNLPDFQLREGTGDLDCAIGGKCTAKVRVSNSYQPREALPVSKFEVSMKVTMRATGLGSRGCSDTATMRPNRSRTMSCTADFALAPSYTPRSYPVRATWSLLAVGKYTPNTKKLSARLGSELSELLDEF